MRRQPIIPANFNSASTIAIPMQEQQVGLVNGLLPEGLANDLKLFGMTYAAGFLFVSLFLY